MAFPQRKLRWLSRSAHGSGFLGKPLRGQERTAPGSAD